MLHALHGGIDECLSPMGEFPVERLHGVRGEPIVGHLPKVRLEGPADARRLGEERPYRGVGDRVDGSFEPLGRFGGADEAEFAKAFTATLPGVVTQAENLHAGSRGEEDARQAVFPGRPLAHHSQDEPGGDLGRIEHLDPALEEEVGTAA
ncbi:hypothetical protein [Streptomyces sp. NPDC057418]|uniref:hypothetical protein n=1 Tax=Streptomyces sp. NPDC057418 TaxID=3346126 RepID=UPI00369289D0